MEVEVDFWENQRYKPLQGGWTRPFTGGVYPFSDISCSNKLEINVNPNQTTFFMPPGWEWSSELWKVDKRNIFGEVDADGWSYAISFEALFDQSLRRALRKERNSRSLVRRRRWVRTRYCKSSKMIEKFAARVDWVTILREKIDAIAKKNHENFFLLSEYHVVKCKTIEKMILSIDAKLDKINESLGALRNKLLLMNTFLEERGEIEQCYAEKLEKLSLKWRDAGDETEVSSYRSKYFSSGNKGSRKDSIDEKVVDEKGKRKGFFEVVSRANDEISRRLHEFSVLLTQGLPAG